MSDIEVGEFVRTSDGYIGKVLKVYKHKRECDTDTYYSTDKVMVSSYYERIKCHSKNLINLIEVGDYVNGSKVLDVMEDMETGEVHLEMTMNYTNEELGDCTIYNKDIETIVTKEQYQANCYVVEREELGWDKEH